MQVVTQVLMGGRLDISKAIASEELSASDVQRSMSSFSAEVDPSKMADDLEGEIEETNIETVTAVEGKTTTVTETTTEHSSNTTTAESAKKNQKNKAMAGTGMMFGLSSSSSESSSKASSRKTDSSEIKVTVAGGGAAAMRAAAYGGEVSQSDLESWASSVPLGGAVLKREVVDISQAILLGDLEACREATHPRFRGLLDEGSEEVDEMLGHLASCLGTVNVPSLKDKKLVHTLAFAMNALVFDAAQTVMSNAGPIANMRQATLHLIDAAKSGMVENEEDCNRVNAFIQLHNQAATMNPAVTNPLPQLDCDSAMLGTSDRISTKLSTDQTALLTYQPSKGHFGAMCAQCLNWMTRVGLGNEDGTKSKPWTYSCDDRLEPEVDSAGCEGLRETIEKVGGGQGEQQRIDSACARSPAEQITAEYLGKVSDHQGAMLIGVHKTELRVPAAFCVFAGACGVDETGLKRSLRAPDLPNTGSGLDPLGQGHYLGGKACSGRNLVVVEQTKSASMDGSLVVIPNDQVSLTLPASVVFTVASRRRGSCSSFAGLKAYAGEASTKGVFG